MADTPHRRLLLAKMREAGAMHGETGSKVALAEEERCRAAIEAIDRDARTAKNSSGMTDLVEVIQADRDAAAAFSEAVAGRTNGHDHIAECRAGKRDATYIVQAFAKHRVCHTRPEVAEALRRLIGSVDDLIADSGGVYGLHLNGDPAPWESLTEGGRFEDWLIELERARAILAKVGGGIQNTGDAANAGDVL